ncbi:LamB/YcsF family protein, partial [Methylobacterium sp. J-030]
MTRVDLNSDLGEGYGAYACGDDAAILDLVTSANVACGLHAGDPEIMARTFALAKEKGVAVGAHPGFPDLWGFGRRRIPFSPDEIERLVAYQVGAAQALAAYAGHRITYVKTHGALGNIAAEERSVADAVARAVRAVDPNLALLAIALSAQ